LGKETKNILDTSFLLKDSEGREFTQTDKKYVVEPLLNYGTQIQPGILIEGYLIFEIPEDSQELTLEISRGWFSNAKIIVNLN
jgi:hypothetical protein